MKKTFLLFITCIISYASFSQGTIRGKITDENGETLIGVTIVLKLNRSVGTITDLDGNYSLQIPDSTSQTLLVSFISYKTIEETVSLHKNEVTVKNFLLKTDAKEMKEVQVSAKSVKAKEYYTETIKKNSATTLDYISSETIKKTGDVNVTAAVARVSGVSTNGSFITVRGIGDRYVKTSINGSRIPTLDPFTNNIKLDLFPASLVDNVIITKTASPDLPGDFAGAYISIETKDYPEELSVNVESSVGYNNQSTFKDVVSTQRSSTDWLGYDNTFRDHNHQTFVQAVDEPSRYQQFVGLGLGPYYNSLGVTSDNWRYASDTYYRLGLVQLGLLSPALINDATAFHNADLQFVTGTYASDAFQVINAKASESGKSFPNNWNTTTRTTPLDFSQSFSIGNQVKLFGKPLGFLFGYRYGSSVKYDPNSISNRLKSDGSFESSLIGPHSEETNGWSALMNVAYKVNPNNSVSFLFMPNLTGVNKADDLLDSRDSSKFVSNKKQYYEQRRQLVYQLKSEHYLPGTKIKAELNASYTNGKSSVPDFKNLKYVHDVINNTYQIGGDFGDISRYYRYLSDNLFDSHASVEFPLSDKPGLTRKLKFGGAYQRSDRTYDQYQYEVKFGDHSDMIFQNNDVDAFFDLSNFGIRSGTVSGTPYSTMNAYYVENGTAANHSFGKSEIGAGFAMVDYSITQRLRFSGGVRVEQSDLFTDVVKFDSLGYGINDSRRVYSDDLPLLNPGKLNETNYLPSANVIYKLKNDDAAPINLRVNYSKTIARPSLRELSEVATLDYEFKEFVVGNADLKTVHIDNYDLRLESYFKNGDNVSVSLFYKNFKNHIELVRAGTLTWQNVDKSYAAGIELEGKKNITRHFEFRANVAFINSETKFVRNRVDLSNGIKVYIPLDTLTRTMFGQAPYVVNGILTYNSDSLGLSVTLSYNVQGKRLVITSGNPAIADVYEVPRDLLDMKVIKKLGKHFGASVTIRDILSTATSRPYKDSELIYDKVTYGTTYVFGVSYKF